MAGVEDKDDDDDDEDEVSESDEEDAVIVSSDPSVVDSDRGGANIGADGTVPSSVMGGALPPSRPYGYWTRNAVSHGSLMSTRVVGIAVAAATTVESSSRPRFMRWEPGSWPWRWWTSPCPDSSTSSSHMGSGFTSTRDPRRAVAARLPRNNGGNTAGIPGSDALIRAPAPAGSCALCSLRFLGIFESCFVCVCTREEGVCEGGGKRKRKKREKAHPWFGGGVAFHCSRLEFSICADVTSRSRDDNKEIRIQPKHEKKEDRRITTIGMSTGVDSTAAYIRARLTNISVRPHCDERVCDTIERIMRDTRIAGPLYWLDVTIDLRTGGGCEDSGDDRTDSYSIPCECMLCIGRTDTDEVVHVMCKLVPGRFVGLDADDDSIVHVYTDRIVDMSEWLGISALFEELGCRLYVSTCVVNTPELSALFDSMVDRITVDLMSAVDDSEDEQPGNGGGQCMAASHMILRESMAHPRTVIVMNNVRYLLADMI